MLAGVRIIEVEGLGPGPFAAMLLADLGADVVVVHRKQSSAVPGMPDQPVIDRGKRSIALDLKDAEDLAVFKKLVATADGLIEGFRPGVMERLGVGPDECMALNPKLVYGRMTGWGQSGPLAEVAGHDYNYIALSGAHWYASLPGQPPIAPPTLVGDIGGGAMYLVVGMLAGIMNARNTGDGTVVDAAIIDGSAHMMNLLMTFRASGAFSPERGKSLLDGPHWSRTYRTSDGGYMSVQCLEPKFYRIFLELMELHQDPDFTEQFDQSRWPQQSERLEQLFLSRSRQAWTELFDGTDACVAPVLEPGEAAQHPQIAARGVWQETGVGLQAAPAPRFSGQPDWQPCRSPARGEHANEILAEIGD